jgi:dihydroorotase (multifunctional complex type)
MAELDLVLTGGTLTDAVQTYQADIGVADGKIAVIGATGSFGGAKRTIEVEGLTVLPGIIDSHVHVRDPGFTHKEDFHSATLAAAAGGVTTIMCQPTTQPPTCTAQALAERIRLGEEKACVDFCIQAGVDPSNLDELPKMAEHGPASYEIFLQDFPPEMAVEDAAAFWRGLEAVHAVGGLAGVYRGDEALKTLFYERLLRTDRKDVLAWNDSRPPELESAGVARALGVIRSHEVRVHFRQISSAAALAWILAAIRAQPGLSVSVEITPHNLLMTREQCRQIGSFAKVIPPQREGSDLEALWDAIEAEELEIIVATDHAPHPKGDKARGADDIWQAPPGFPGVQTMLPLMLNEVSQGRISLNRLVRLCSEAPAQRFGIYPRKGAFFVGSDADFTVVDMDAVRELRSDEQLTKAGFTPFDGWKGRGFPVKTIVRGSLVSEDQSPQVEPGFGRYVPAFQS